MRELVPDMSRRRRNCWVRPDKRAWNDPHELESERYCEQK
jgi:hypothetical protein